MTIARKDLPSEREERVQWKTDDMTDNYAIDVLAWQPLPDPYNPDHIRDTTKKVDQFREPTKMMQEERQ